VAVLRGFAGRILLALINVLTHSAVGGEPVTQRTRALKTAWGVHTTANTPPRFLALINVCATPSIGLQLVTRAAVASVRSPKVCALLCAHVWNLCTFVDIYAGMAGVAEALFANATVGARRVLALRVCSTDHPIQALVDVLTPSSNLLVAGETDTPV